MCSWWQSWRFLTVQLTFRELALYSEMFWLPLWKQNLYELYDLRIRWLGNTDMILMEELARNAHAVPIAWRDCKCILVVYNLLLFPLWLEKANKSVSALKEIKESMSWKEQKQTESLYANTGIFTFRKLCRLSKNFLFCTVIFHFALQAFRVIKCLDFKVYFINRSSIQEPNSGFWYASITLTDFIMNFSFIFKKAVFDSAVVCCIRQNANGYSKYFSIIVMHRVTENSETKIRY